MQLSELCEKLTKHAHKNQGLTFATNIEIRAKIDEESEVFLDDDFGGILDGFH